MKKKIVIGVIVSLIVLFAIGGPLLLKDPKSKTENLVEIKRGKVVDAVYGIGTLTAERSIAIKSGVTSGIQKLYVKEGESVKKGQRLVDLEGVGGFRAPFDGTVSSIALKEGESVFSQTSIMTVTDRSELYLSVSIEQQGALKVKPGLPVRISFDGMREKSFSGRVESVYANGSDFISRISIRSLPNNILPGMTADVAIVLSEKEDVLLMPVAAVDEGEVKVSRDGKTRSETVKLGLIDGAYAEVLSGNVTAGDKVVIIAKEGAK